MPPFHMDMSATVKSLPTLHPLREVIWLDPDQPVAMERLMPSGLPPLQSVEFTKLVPFKWMRGIPPTKSPKSWAAPGRLDG